MTSSKDGPIDIRKVSRDMIGGAVGDQVTVTVWPSGSEELRSIILEHFPSWLELFARKNTEYQDGMGTAFVLGERGQFSDMWRKFMKLKRAMWDGQELTTEGVDEILMDLIGHCFLTLEMRRRAAEKESIAQNRFEVENMAQPHWVRVIGSADVNSSVYEVLEVNPNKLLSHRVRKLNTENSFWIDGKFLTRAEPPQQIQQGEEDLGDDPREGQDFDYGK